jgi:hypothetical protein
LKNNAALRFWMSLPEDLQAKLISEELGEDDFLSLITQIIDDRIRAIKQSLYKDIRKKPISRPRSAIRHPVKRQAGKARRKS